MDIPETAVDTVERYLLRLRLAMGDVPVLQRDEFMREIRSHIIERLEHEPGTSEQACAAILKTLGDPEVIARDYRSEWLMARASRLQWLTEQASRLHIPRLPLRTAVRWTLTGIQCFIVMMVGIVGYTFAAAFAITAVLKPVFPNNIGLFVSEAGVQIANLVPQGTEILGPSYIPVALLLGFSFAMGTHGSIRWISGRFRQIRRYL